MKLLTIVATILVLSALRAQSATLPRQIKLVAPRGAAGFGTAVALSGDGSTALIGGSGTNNQGAVYIYVHQGTDWIEQAQITALDGAPFDSFGESLALSDDGNTALIGAWLHDGPRGAGAAYVFTRNGTAWNQQAQLTANTGLMAFGKVLALSADGSTALMSAYEDADAAAVYVFRRSSVGWVRQDAPFSSPHFPLFDEFGSSVAVSSNGAVVLIGAPGVQSRVPPGVYITTGAVYTYAFVNGVWVEQKGLSPLADGLPGDNYGIADFGASVALSADGSRAIVGAPMATREPFIDYCGKVYVLDRNGSDWSTPTEVLAPSPAFQDRFGTALSISKDGRTALANAPGKRAAYLFSLSPNGSTLDSTLRAADEAPFDATLQSVALAGNSSAALIGAHQVTAAYLFTSAATGVPVNVTFFTAPLGLQIAAGATVANTPYLQYLMPGTALPIAALSPQRGGPGYRFVFRSWDNGGPQSQIQVVPSADVSFTAQFGTQAQLTLLASPPIGGSVAANPSSSELFYDIGQGVVITAAASNGYIFTGFSGDATGATSPTTVMMSKPLAVTANFAPAIASSVIAIVTNDISRATQPGPSVMAQIAFENSGAALNNVAITSLAARVLSPSGSTASVTSTLPVLVGAIPASGASRPVAIGLSIPAEAQRILVSGVAVTDRGGFSFSFTVIRPSASSAGPSIASVTPANARRGQTIQINGSNFDAACGNDTIIIGGARQHPTGPCTSSTITLAIPYEASSGSVTVQVIAPKGQSNTVNFTLAPTQLVVATNLISNLVSLLDFSDPNAPVVTTLRPAFGSGAYTVDVKGTVLAVGDTLGQQVGLFDVKNPSAPVKVATINTGRSSIGVLKLTDKYLLAGDAHGTQVTLIDVTDRSLPRIVSTVSSQMLPVGSIGFSNNKAVVSGPNSPLFGLIDYTDPGHPTVSTIAPRAGSALVADLDGNVAAIGATDGPQVSLVDVTSSSVVSRTNTPICNYSAAPVVVSPKCVGPMQDQFCPDTTCYSSINISGRTVVVASANHQYVGLVNFSDLSQPSVSVIDPQVGLAAPTIAFNGDYLAAGGNYPAAATSIVSWFRIVGATVTRLATVNSGLPSIQNLAISTF